MDAASSPAERSLERFQALALWAASIATVMMAMVIAPTRLLMGGWPSVTAQLAVLSGWALMAAVSVISAALVRQQDAPHAVMIYLGGMFLVIADFALFESDSLATICLLLGLPFVLQVAMAIDTVQRARAWTLVVVGLYPALFILRQHLQPLPQLAAWSEYIPALVGPTLAILCLGQIGVYTLTILHKAVYNAEARAEELAGLTHDLELARDAALVSSKTKSAFLANMSHELRTPMNAIIGYSELILEDADPGFEFSDDVERIHAAGRHLLGLINEVLDLSKIEAGRVPVKLGSFSLASLLSDVADTVRPAAQAHGTELILRGDGDVCSDEVKLRQILLNLMGNSVKFTRGGQITLEGHLETKPSGRWLVFTVTDTGIGIPQHKLQEMFEPFTQADESTTREYGGTGLGLAIAKQLAQLLGGELTAESTPGEGSCFCLSVPAEGQATATPAPSRRAPPAPQGDLPVVLLVDDDPDVIAIVQRTLASLPVHIIAVSDGAAAIELCKARRPVVVLLDVMMPGIDGLEVLERLKKEPSTAQIPVCMLTIVQEQQRAWALGATDYLLKPIDRSRLVDVVAAHASGDHGLRVLVVDDDEPDVREIASRALTAAGHRVTTANDGAQALVEIENLRPDLILLDLMMPHVDGLQVLDRLEAHPLHASIPVIVMTAMDMDEATRAALSRRVHTVTLKGSGWLLELAAEVERLL